MVGTAGGVAVGDPVTGTGQALAVELGPGLMGTIYDGTQRPLEAISCLTKSIYIPRGIDVPALNREKTWDFKPGTFNVGDHITGGDIWGSVFENNLLDDHKIILPPRARGRITRIAEAGSYTVTERLFAIEFDGNETEYGMMHVWPGGTVCIPGAFGSGKTVISQSISKFPNSNVIVHVGCGKRGNEMAEVLKEFPRLSINMNGKMESVMRRTCLVANASNMPVAAREASIYTGITISEYFRDQGENAEALCEIYGRLGEMPADQGFPAYLGSKLASFYERAGRALVLGSAKRKGSISIVGSVSPPGGNFSDPVTSCTLGIVQVFWGLDKKLAQRKHFPSINISLSYSKYSAALEAYYEKHRPGFLQLRDNMMKLLSNSEALKKLVQLVGKAVLNDHDKITLDVASMVEEDFLPQNGYSDYDQFCPLWKTEHMMKAFMLFYDESQWVISQSHKWVTVQESTTSTSTAMRNMKFEIPDDEATVIIKYKDILHSISERFASFLTSEVEAEERAQPSIC